MHSKLANLLIRPRLTQMCSSLRVTESIGKSTSLFGRKAEEFLNIRITETESFNDIVGNNITCSKHDLDATLKDLLLENFDRDSVRTYKPQLHKDLPKHAQTFLYKLSTVVNNNHVQVEPAHVEDYIHDLMDNVLKAAGFEDGTDLILMPCMLRLYIGSESLAAYADREGRRGTEIIWVLDEDKHKFDRRWKRGDIQLIANMIAAAQTNETTLGIVYPRNVLGIKFDADCLYFYSARVTKEYLDELTAGEQPGPLVVYKFPKERQLSLSIVKDRGEIFTYLGALRQYALTLDALYADA